MLHVVAVVLAVGGGAGVMPAGQDGRPPAPVPIDLPAPEGRTRAISGDPVEFQGRVFRLDRLSCPAPGTDAGLRAKALMNTLLRGPYVECLVLGGPAGMPIGRCSRDGRGVAAGAGFTSAMRQSGLCD